MDRRGRASRRGASVAVVVLMLAVIALAVIGTVGASGEEAYVGAMRAETARAFYAAESGARTVRLSVWEWRTGAIALYERLGFHRAGKRLYYYDRGEAGRMDALVMRLDLTSKPT
jgi:hypothetical protein